MTNLTVVGMVHTKSCFKSHNITYKTNFTEELDLLALKEKRLYLSAIELQLVDVREFLEKKPS